MDSKNILLLGLKGSVIAVRKDTGARLWVTKLKGSDFVSVAADDTCVFAHTGGNLFCLDLQTGSLLWQDPLAGLGYGMASVAFPGMSQLPVAAYEKKRRDMANDSAATHSPTT